MSAGDRVLTSFDGPVHAVVVGASRGIGLAFARALAGDPGVVRLVATARAPEDCPDLQALARSDPARVRAVALDVTDEDSVRAAAQAAAAFADRVDLVVNCAGALHDAGGLWPERRLADVAPENLARSFAINATGPLLVAKHLEPTFDRRGRTVLATLSARVGSIGDNGLGGWYAYRASKAAQNMITRNLSIELRRRARGIICVALHPGTVDTGLSAPFQSRVPPEKLFTADRAARQLLVVMDDLEPDDNGRFFAWDGQEIPW